MWVIMGASGQEAPHDPAEADLWLRRPAYSAARVMFEGVLQIMCDHCLSHRLSTLLDFQRIKGIIRSVSTGIVLR